MEAVKNSVVTSCFVDMNAPKLVMGQERGIHALSPALEFVWQVILVRECAENLVETVISGI